MHPKLPLYVCAVLLQCRLWKSGHFDNTKLQVLSVLGASKPTGVLSELALRQQAVSRPRAAAHPRRAGRSPRGRRTAPFPSRRHRVRNPPEAGLTETKTGAAARPEPTIPTAPPGKRPPKPGASGPPGRPPNPDERDAAPSNAPPGAAAGVGGRAPPSPRGLVLSSLGNWSSSDLGRRRPPCPTPPRRPAQARGPRCWAPARLPP